tara:strand:- start:419 stop:844 length:426 start_codon:yes stop_codon:yes gene_type:complete
MINIFNNNKKKTKNNDSLSKIASLLIHAAKIDESYTKEEKEIIKKTLLELGAQSTSLERIMADATIIEENSNQILDFTREVKSIPESDKIKIVESLWKIIYSNSNADMYETNLMRRLSGLLYINNKTMADIKQKVKKELTK